MQPVLITPVEPDASDRWDIPTGGTFRGTSFTGDSTTSVTITDEGIEVDVSGEITPEMAMNLAAALVSAAQVAGDD